MTPHSRQQQQQKRLAGCTEEQKAQPDGVRIAKNTHDWHQGGSTKFIAVSMVHIV